MNTSGELESLRRRICRLEESEVARNLLHRYAEVLDNPTPDAVSALFTPDGVLSVPSGNYYGREAIADFYRTRIDSDAGEKRHFIMNLRSHPLKPGTVEIASYFIFIGRDPTASALGWGTYHDTIVLDGNVAFFQRKEIVPHVATNLQNGWAIS